MIDRYDRYVVPAAWVALIVIMLATALAWSMFCVALAIRAGRWAFAAL